MPDFLTLKEASKHTGYNQDYLGQLVRTGKIDGHKVGKSWVVEKPSLVDYLASTGKTPTDKSMCVPLDPNPVSQATLKIKKNLTRFRFMFITGLVVGIIFSLGLISNGTFVGASVSQLYKSLLAAVHLADFAKEINYQGKMRSVSTNQAVSDDDYSIIFKIYNSLEGGSAIWTEPQTVHTSNGLFSVSLGSVTSLNDVNLNQPLYLSVKVGADA